MHNKVLLGYTASAKCSTPHTSVQSVVDCHRKVKRSLESPEPCWNISPRFKAVFPTFGIFALCLL